MFFYLSKIFWFFAQPLNLALFLLLAAGGSRSSTGAGFPPCPVFSPC